MRSLSRSPVMHQHTGPPCVEYMAIQHSRWPKAQKMTPQAWARGPDFLMVQPCSSAYCRASRMCLCGWSAMGVSTLLAADVYGTAIIPCGHHLKVQGVVRGLVLS